MAHIVKVLLVDDDDVDRMAVRRALKVSGLEVAIGEAKDCATAISALTQGVFDCVFLDYMLPDGDGLSVLRAVREAGILTPIVILTGHGDERLAVEIMQAGALDYLPKAKMSPETLSHSLHTAIRLHEAKTERKRAEEELRKSHSELQETHHRLQETHEHLLQSEKMASIGQLAAGVAHEINNPIGYILSNIGTLQQYLRDLFRLLEAYEATECGCRGLARRDH